MTGNEFSRFLDLLEKSVDREMSAAEIRSLVEEGYHRLACSGEFPQDSRQDLHLLEHLMAELGWQTYGSPTALEKNQPSMAEFGDLTVENCFARGVLRPGCGSYLDCISSTSTQADSLMENLLRHVEVKRQASLSKFSQELPQEAQWLERSDVSILFSRYARRRHDLRFLNAAFKMNEWYLKHTQRTDSEAVHVRFLLALAEQELSAKELLAC
ncbi:hypothetical protein [Pelolinea submarina]|uniref:Uncharacterized protein n=1 Tax=Pelolinea submarina TaxID=913107 RepID=A0A347ZW33_9CHLR|nr:hypothetical protein [Pelolinea submarina]REG07209.1 hypothetical protein DFR64_2414 [Pelolinea submarina]BBB49514.1 hypothetical protein Pelsub_P2745 [Pelolinea submarina]